MMTGKGLEESEGGMEVGAHSGAHFQLVSPDSEKKTEIL